MHPVDDRRALGFQGLGRGDVGLDHELFDQAVRGQPVGRDDALDPAVLVDQDLALGEIEIERLAPVARSRQRGIGGPERFEGPFQQRLGLGARTAVDGGLRLLVGQLGGRAHHGAQERVPLLVAVAVEDHACNETGPLFAFLQRAQVVGNLLRQHRHDAIGEVDRVAPHLRLAVELRA